MAKKIASKKSAKAASKKVASKVEKEAEGPSTAWNAGQKMTLNGVRVAGKEHRSVWAAFQALGMGEDSGVSRGQHIRFRKALKAKGVGGKLTFVDPRNDKKKYEFTLLKAATPA